MTAAHDMQRFARHLLLAEIGAAGQARLCAARVRIPDGSDARAARVARDYLERAGLEVAASAQDAVDVAHVEAVRSLAGRAELEEAAAALAGAFAAVEAIKAVLGAGTRASLPEALSLTGEVRG
jgi:hypothetical protein